MVPVVRKRLKQRTGPGSIISASGAEEKIKASKAPRFKAGKAFKALVNK